MALSTPIGHGDLVRQAIPRARLCVIENCGRLPPYEKPEEVNPIMLSFLKN